MLTLAAKADLALRIVREAPLFSFDTETSGLDWQRNSVVGYVVCEGTTSLYVPVRHGGGCNLNDPNVGPLINADDETNVHRFEIELAKAMEARRGRAVLHNAKFDAHMAWNHGVFLGRDIEDTSINEALLDEYAKGYSLAACAARRGVTAKKGDELYQHLSNRFGGKADPSSMGDFWRLPGNDPLGTEYAEGDGITTLELREKQIKQIEEEGLGFIHGIESELIWTVVRMERRGIKVDLDKVEEVKAELLKRLGIAQQKMPEGFNVRSSAQVKALMEDTGHLDWPVTALQNPSFTEKWLKTHDVGRDILAIRKLTNLSNSFITPLLERHVVNGRVHCSFNQNKTDEFGTISGRFSSSNPNMQQVPRRDKELSKLFRVLFIPDAGMRLYEADFSQQEPSAFAHYSQDENLLQGYRATPRRDIHTLTAELLNVERDPRGKRIAMALLTGQQPKSFAEHMDMELGEASLIYHKWFEGFPGIKKFQMQAKNRILERGYVLTILGRRCRLDDRRFAYRAVSKIIQGFGADLMKYKLLEVDKTFEFLGDHTHLLSTVHDSLVFQTPDDKYGADVAKDVVRIMADVEGPPFNMTVPFKVDLGSGLNWSDATFGGKQ